jgi:hypothetical protein
MNENNQSFYPSDIFEFIHHPEYGCRNLKGLKRIFCNCVASATLILSSMMLIWCPYLAISIIYLTKFSSSVGDKMSFLPLFLNKVSPMTWPFNVLLGMS